MDKIKACEGNTTDRQVWNAMKKRTQSSYLYESNDARKSELAFKGCKICQAKKQRKVSVYREIGCKETL